jgi:hypothetical protein
MIDELIFLEFPDNAWYVVGHVSQAEAEAAAVEAWEGYYCGDDPPEWGPVEHMWGMWEPVNEDDDGVHYDATHTWHTRLTEAPGYFPVTILPRAAWLAERAELERIRQEAREWCAERLPDLKVEAVYASVERDCTSVRLAPWRGQRVMVWPWCGDDGHVQVGWSSIPWQNFARMLREEASP